MTLQFVERNSRPPVQYLRGPPGGHGPPVEDLCFRRTRSKAVKGHGHRTEPLPFSVKRSDKRQICKCTATQSVGHSVVPIIPRGQVVSLLCVCVCVCVCVCQQSASCQQVWCPSIRRKSSQTASTQLSEITTRRQQ